ncbi:hypothetical protein F0562_000943 [Nyssa sinensis]|uniref:Uncharacterized protein n=1 Tax=Nyssa sinensis TaxID=561372 RepID=A0A5J5C259_9ASTE|nr:hypothetical protein F0562_000943 [Nyssa sinensis]
MSKKDLINVSFLSRPTLGFQDHIHECQTAPSVDGKLQEKEQKHEQEEDQKREIEISSLELVRRPSLGEFRKAGEDDDDDGFRTPTSLDHRMPLIPQCPPAPRKPKSLPLTKRKADGSLRILLDLSNEIESLFPPALLGDLGGKIKKLRKNSFFSDFRLKFMLCGVLAPDSDLILLVKGANDQI